MSSFLDGMVAELRGVKSGRAHEEHATCRDRLPSMPSKLRGKTVRRETTEWKRPSFGNVPELDQVRTGSTMDEEHEMLWLSADLSRRSAER